MFDRWKLYKQMLRSRLLEEAIAQLWEEGLISGEMHLGTGEEAVVAGVVTQLNDGDAMALDHRGTAPLVMRGVRSEDLLRELLGQENGLCKGMGGHMHLFSKENLAASSGIVGASGPAGAGFALSAQYLRPRAVAAAFCGEGAMNQGMMLETINLAVVWGLPLLLVCKDDNRAITTRSATVTGGTLVERIRGFGMPAVEVDGTDVTAVWRAAREALNRARSGQGPTFLHAHCVHLEGHFLGDPLVRIARQPWAELKGIAGPMIASATRRKGAPLPKRVKGLLEITHLVGETLKQQWSDQGDPLGRIRQELKKAPQQLKILEASVVKEVGTSVKTVL